MILLLRCIHVYGAAEGIKGVGAPITDDPRDV